MSRSGYTDDYCDDQWAMIRWRGAVKAAIKGRRGQAFLREMLEALDAMAEKVLIAESLVEEDGAVCAMGAVALKRGLDVSKVDPYDREQVAQTFGIPESLAAEISYENDERDYAPDDPAKRWTRMRAWVVAHIQAERAVAE
jgi:hypothetical protein